MSEPPTEERIAGLREEIRQAGARVGVGAAVVFASPVAGLRWRGR